MNTNKAQRLITYVGKAADLSVWFIQYVDKFGVNATLGDVALWVSEGRLPSKRR